MYIWITWSCIKQTPWSPFFFCPWRCGFHPVLHPSLARRSTVRWHAWLRWTSPASMPSRTTQWKLPTPQIGAADDSFFRALLKKKCSRQDGIKPTLIFVSSRCPWEVYSFSLICWCTEQFFHMLHVLTEYHGRAINIYPKNRKHVDKYIPYMEHLAVGPRNCFLFPSSGVLSPLPRCPMSHGRRQTRLTALDIVAFMLRDPVDFRRVRVTESRRSFVKTMSAASKGSLKISYDIFRSKPKMWFSPEFDRFSPDIWYLVHHVPKGWTP